MKNLICISTLLTSLLLLQACATQKKTERHDSVTNDTLVQQARQHATSITEQQTEREVKDTAVGVAGKKVRDTIPEDGLEPAITKTGKKVPRSYSKKENGLTAWVKVDTNGQVTYGATADSMTIVIAGLVREQKYMSHRYDSLSAVLQQRTHVATMATTTEVKKTKTFWGYAWPWLTALLIAALLVGGYKWLKRMYR